MASSDLIFVDASAWIALTDKSDKYHRQSAAIYVKIKEQRKQLVTSDYVISETATRIRYDAGHADAVRFLDLVMRAVKLNALKIIFVDDELFRAATSIFRKYDDAALSFVDCTSFAVCRLIDINQSFYLDQHFTMMGIALLT